MVNGAYADLLCFQTYHKLQVVSKTARVLFTPFTIHLWVTFTCPLYTPQVVADVCQGLNHGDLDLVHIFMIFLPFPASPSSSTLYTSSYPRHLPHLVQRLRCLKPQISSPQSLYFIITCSILLLPSSSYHHHHLVPLLWPADFT